MEPWPEGPPTDPFQQVTVAPQRQSAGAGSQGNRMEKEYTAVGQRAAFGREETQDANV